jgi:hypothetical protein
VRVRTCAREHVFVGAWIRTHTRACAGVLVQDGMGVSGSDY